MTRKKSRKRKKARPAKAAAGRRGAKASAGGKRRANVPRKNRTRIAAKPNVIETLVAASAQALALPIDPTWRAGVQRNLQLILTHAKIVEQFSLPDEIEPAPVFRA